MGGCALGPSPPKLRGRVTGKASGPPSGPPHLQPLTHVSWVPKKKTWYLLAVDFTAASGISSIWEQDEGSE